MHFKKNQMSFEQQMVSDLNYTCWNNYEAYSGRGETWHFHQIHKHLNQNILGLMLADITTKM